MRGCNWRHLLPKRLHRMRERWPQKEPILVDGSLVQLGDLTIVPHREGDGTLKLSIYRDEWPDQWQDFVKSPMKLVTTQFPKLVLCKGQSLWGYMRKISSASGHRPGFGDFRLVVALLAEPQGKEIHPQTSKILQSYLFSWIFRDNSMGSLP